MNDAADIFLGEEVKSVSHCFLSFLRNSIALSPIKPFLSQRWISISSVRLLNHLDDCFKLLQQTVFYLHVGAQFILGLQNLLYLLWAILPISVIADGFAIISNKKEFINKIPYFGEQQLISFPVIEYEHIGRKATVKWTWMLLPCSRKYLSFY